MAAQQRVDPANPQDLTTPIQAERDWSEDRPHAILGRLDPPVGWYDAPVPRPLIDASGLPVNGKDGKPKLNFTFLPPQLSSKLEPYRMETYFRMHSSITYHALWHRQPAWMPTTKPKYRNALNNQRRRKGRDPYLARDWSRRYTGRPTRVLVELIGSLTSEQVVLNTTWTVVTTSRGKHIANPKNPSQIVRWDYYLDGKPAHQPSKEVDEALEEHRRLMGLAHQHNLSHWRDLPQDQLPKTWYSRKKGGNTKEDEDAVEGEDDGLEGGEDAELEWDDQELLDKQAGPSQTQANIGTSDGLGQAQQGRNPKRARPQEDESEGQGYDTPITAPQPYHVRGGQRATSSRPTNASMPAPKRRAIAQDDPANYQTGVRSASSQRPDYDRYPKYIDNSGEYKDINARNFEAIQAGPSRSYDRSHLGEPFGVENRHTAGRQDAALQGAKRRRQPSDPYEELEQDEEVRAPKRQRLPSGQGVPRTSDDAFSPTNTPSVRMGARHPLQSRQQQNTGYASNLVSRQSPRQVLTYGNDGASPDSRSLQRRNPYGSTRGNTDFNPQTPERGPVPNYNLVPRSRPSTRNLLPANLRQSSGSGARSTFMMPEKKLPSQRTQNQYPPYSEPAVSRQRNLINTGSGPQSAGPSRMTTSSQAQVSASGYGPSQAQGGSQAQGSSSQAHGGQRPRKLLSPFVSPVRQTRGARNTGFDPDRQNHGRLQLQSVQRTSNQVRGPSQSQSSNQGYGTPQQRRLPSQYQGVSSGRGGSQVAFPGQAMHPAPRSSQMQPSDDYADYDTAYQQPRQQRSQGYMGSSARSQQTQQRNDYRSMENNADYRSPHLPHTSASSSRSQFTPTIQDSQLVYNSQTELPSPGIAPENDDRFSPSQIYTEESDEENDPPSMFPDLDEFYVPPQHPSQGLSSYDAPEPRVSQASNQGYEVSQSQPLSQVQGALPLQELTEVPVEHGEEEELPSQNLLPVEAPAKLSPEEVDALLESLPPPGSPAGSLFEENSENITPAVLPQSHPIEPVPQSPPPSTPQQPPQPLSPEANPNPNSQASSHTQGHETIGASEQATDMSFEEFEAMMNSRGGDSQIRIEDFDIMFREMEEEGRVEDGPEGW